MQRKLVLTLKFESVENFTIQKIGLGTELSFMEITHLKDTRLIGVNQIQMTSNLR